MIEGFCVHTVMCFARYPVFCFFDQRLQAKLSLKVFGKNTTRTENRVVVWGWETEGGWGGITL